MAWSDSSEVFREIKAVYTTRGIEDNTPPPLLEDLAAEYDVPLVTLRAEFVRGDWDEERLENITLYKQRYRLAREQVLEKQALDVAGVVRNIMVKRIDFLNQAATTIDGRLLQAINNPELPIKLGDLIKLKEVVAKEAGGVIDTLMKVKEELEDRTKKGTAAAPGTPYAEVVRTAFELQEGLREEGGNALTEEADALFTRLDHE